MFHEASQAKKDLKALQNLDISIDALQRIVNTVAFGGKDIEIELTLTNGNKLVIRKSGDDTPAFETFAERAAKAKRNRI